MPHKIIVIEGGKRVEQKRIWPTEYMSRLWHEYAIKIGLEKPPVPVFIDKDIQFPPAATENLIDPKAPMHRARRKGLGPKQLKWLRANCQPFKDMEAKSKASKLVSAKVGK